jgi:hypothetical protein
VCRARTVSPQYRSASQLKKKKKKKKKKPTTPKNRQSQKKIISKKKKKSQQPLTPITLTMAIKNISSPLFSRVGTTGQIHLDNPGGADGTARGVVQGNRSRCDC